MAEIGNPDNATVVSSISLNRIPHTFRLLLVLGILGVVYSTWNSISDVRNPLHSLDLHSYWYSGHFVRQGSDPYQAYLANESPAVPVQYLDGKSTESGQVAQKGLIKVPANTAPILFLLTPFAFFSWPTTKMLWLLCNLAFMFCIPWLLVRLLPERSLPFPYALLISLLFYNLHATRIALWHGQTTMLVLLLMVCSLLTLNRSWAVSGLLLGLALSKYSLAQPVVLFALYKRNYRVVAVGLAVQLMGVLAVSLAFDSSPLSVLEAYATILAKHLVQNGIHFVTLFEQRTSFLGYGLVIFGSLAMFTVLWKWVSPWHRYPNDASTAVVDFNIVTILTLWNLLVAYHRDYDVTVAVFFVALAIFALVRHDVWKRSRRGNLLIMGSLVFFLLTQFAPIRNRGNLLSDEQFQIWLRLVDHGITVSLILALATSLWMLSRLFVVKDLPAILRSEPVR